MKAARGFSTAEAMVAAALAGVAMAGLASAAALATDSLRLARDTATALAVAADGLERVRAGEPPPTDAAGADGRPFARTCDAGGGRGRLLRARCVVTWGAHRVTLATEVPS